jgi:hypothetical protein
MAYTSTLALSIRRTAPHRPRGGAIIDMDCIAPGKERKNPDVKKMINMLN